MRSIIHADAVEAFDIHPSPTDAISRMYGVGGEEYNFRRRVDNVRFVNFHIEDMMLDSGRVDGINGLIGLDILRSGGFFADLRLLEISRNTATITG